MPNDEWPSLADLLEGHFAELSVQARCRHACHCGCHFGRLKHIVPCTSCKDCGRGHTNIALALVTEHLLSCHRPAAVR